MAESNEMGKAYMVILPTLDKRAMSSALSGLKGACAAAGDKAASALSGVAKAAAATAAAGVASAVAATVAISKQALECYSAYEQNVGGIQKLFGNMGKDVEEYAALTGQQVDSIREKWQVLEDSQNLVLANASEAYKNAGLSANAYMQTVTGFSAALISSLGGDTAKAAELANTAVVDMSDNANTFGTNIQDIQNAYQGFAKQNYTMLDNLRLGYGGTASEMARLVNESGVMGSTFKATAKNINSVGFDKIIEAIHVMQERMQVAGTTSREAATTIEGSVNMMKAAWENWLTGLGDEDADMSALTSNLVSSVETAASNVIPRVSQIVQTLVGQLPQLVADVGPQLAGALTDMLTSAVEGVKAVLPPELSAVVSEAQQFVTGMGQVLQTADNPFEAFALAGQYSLNKLVEYLPTLSGIADSAVSGLTDGLSQAGSVVLELGGRVVPMLAEGISAALPQLIEFGGSAIQMLADGITAALPVLAEAASGILSSLGQYFGENGGQLIDSGLQIILQLSQSLLDNAPTLVEGALQLMQGLGQGIIDAIPVIIETVPQIVSNIANVINENAPTILACGLELLSQLAVGLVENIPVLVENIPAIIQAVVDAWSAFSWVDLGTKAITALGNGIKAMIGAIGSAGQSVLQAVVNAIMSLPSRLMSLGSQAGGMLSSGLRGLVGSVASAASSLLSSVVNGLASLPGKLWDVGTQAVQGLINGISNMAGSVVGAITGVVGGAIDAAKNLLGIHSPSRVFRSFGGLSMEGLNLGFTDKVGEVVKTVKRTMGSVVQAAAVTLPSLDLDATVSARSLAARAVAPSGYVGGGTSGLEGWLDRNLGKIIEDHAPTATLTEREARRMARGYAFG